MRAAMRLDSNRRVLLVLALIAAGLFVGSILFIISRAH